MRSHGAGPRVSRRCARRRLPCRPTCTCTRSGRVWTPPPSCSGSTGRRWRSGGERRRRLGFRRSDVPPRLRSSSGSSWSRPGKASTRASTETTRAAKRSCSGGGASRRLSRPGRSPRGVSTRRPPAMAAYSSGSTLQRPHARHRLRLLGLPHSRTRPCRADLLRCAERPPQQRARRRRWPPRRRARRRARWPPRAPSGLELRRPHRRGGRLVRRRQAEGRSG